MRVTSLLKWIAVVFALASMAFILALAFNATNVPVGVWVAVFGALVSSLAALLYPNETTPRPGEAQTEEHRNT